MSSHQMKDHVRDKFEAGFDRLHRIADVVTFPLAPLDGAIHGTARGVLNWLTDTHPAQRNTNSSSLPTNTSSLPTNTTPQPPHGQSFWPPQQQQPSPQYGYGGGHYGYPSNSPPPPPPPAYNNNYYRQGQPQPYYGSQRIQNVKDGHGNNTGHNNGAVKIGNYGGA